MRIKESANEFGKTKSLVAMAMLLALRLALGYVTNIQLTESIKIGFTIFPTTIACMMFGPVPGLVMGGAADLIGFFLKPTGPFFPGYTLDSMVAGFLYGCFFYRREKLTLWRVMAALAAVTVVVNLCMTTSWISIQYGVKDLGLFFRDGGAAWESFRLKFSAIFGGRFVKNAIMYPINVVGVYFFLSAVREIPILRPMINDGKIVRPSLHWKEISSEQEKDKGIWSYLAEIAAILFIGVFIGISIGMPIGTTKGRKEAEETFKRQEQMVTEKLDKEQISEGMLTTTPAPTEGGTSTEVPKTTDAPTEGNVGKKGE